MLTLVFVVAVAPVLVDLVDRAARRAGLSQKELALAQGIGIPQ